MAAFESHPPNQVWETLTGQCLQTLTTPGSTEVTRLVHLVDKRRFLATGWNRRITTFKDQVSALKKGL